MRALAHRWRAVIVLLGVLIICPTPDKASPSVENEALAAYLRIFPGVKNIGVIYSESRNEEPVKNLTQSAKQNNINLIKVKVSSIKEFPKACREVGAKVDTVWVFDDLIYTSVPDAWSYFILLTVRNSLKTVVHTEEALSSGGLFYYNAQKEIVINRRILKVMGLEVPEDAGPVKYLGGS